MAKSGKVSKEFETVGAVVRPDRARKYRYLYLIVCEDENTERVYFESFKSRIPGETIFLMAVGTGNDPLGVVERAIIERSKLATFCRKEVDVVWVVFDKDDADANPARIKRFEKAIEMGKSEQFQLAFSNECFELWLLLHFIDVDPAIPMGRKFIYEELQRVVRTFAGHEDFVYKHGDKAILEKVAFLGDEQAALGRAETLIHAHKGVDLIDANPVTYVGRLVLDLYSWIEYYSYD